MTLYDLIMEVREGFTKEDWSQLGKGNINDEETVKRMLMAGYEAIADDE